MSFIVQCPNCNQHIEILEVNCQVFRCGIFKENYQQIEPHLPKEICDRLASEDKIFGCGKPFMLVKTSSPQFCGESNNHWIPQICDYI